MPDERAISDYLGDGVHARFDPDTNQIWLIVEGVRLERVALDPEVFDALVEFACRCWPLEREDETTMQPKPGEP